MRLSIFAALTALALGSFGCVSRPVISVDHAEVRGASLSGVGIVVFLEIDNPNSYDVQIRNVRADVTVAGTYRLTPIEASPNKWLPAKQTTMVSVPAWIPWTLVPALLAESQGTGEISYQVKGTADVTAVRALGIDQDNYPIDEKGTIPRQMIADAARSFIPFF